MLVNCPKCGFSQPKDRYCASCGVDMQLFRPARPPWHKKILLNPILHAILIVALVFASILFVRQKQREELKARIEYLKAGPLLVERSNRDKEKVQLDASPEAQSRLASGNTPPAAAPPRTEVDSLQAITESSPPVPEAGPGGAGTAPKPALGDTSPRNPPSRVLAVYAEIEIGTLNAWAEEMRNTNQYRVFDEVSMGPLPAASEKLKTGKGVKVLQRVEHNISQFPTSFDWFVGTHRGPDPDNEIGLFSSLSLTDAKENLIRGELEVQRAFRDPKDTSKTMERVSSGGPFELTPGQGFLMRGILPRKFISDLSNENNVDPVLSIFESTAFREGRAELTLILEFDTSLPSPR